MKKYLLPSIIVLGLIAGYAFYRYPQAFRRQQPEISSTSTSNLPKDWQAITAKNVALKLEKNISGIKPQIVLTVSTSTEASATPAKYTDSLIAGAKSTIPSLKFTDDKRKSEEGMYTARLTGYYYNQKDKIEVLQRVYIQKSKVSVLTASFQGNLNQEVSSIFDTLEKEKLGL